MDEFYLEQEEAEFAHYKKLVKRKAKAYEEYEREQEEQQNEIV